MIFRFAKGLMTMKRWIALAAVVVLGVCALYPGQGFTEDKDTVLMARAIYALCHDESYDTKLAVATVMMNRVENPWFGDSLKAVLNEQHQFPIGRRYDAESLNAAHAALAGRRTLSAAALYYQSSEATQRRKDAPLQTVGGFSFYSTDAHT